ncbi:MAG: hypothetical protein MUE60_16220 [Candidatus Eisenbacteria bacterium]|nr:hypothetical protein [Candidatus Eisenbacteria bacterium]
MRRIRSPARRAAAVAGWISLSAGVSLLCLAAWAWPPGGLMFALPFLFLAPGVVLCLAGLLLIQMSRKGGELRTSESRDEGGQEGAGG